MFKYFLVGLLFWAFGTLFHGGSAAFQSRSEPAMLLVVDMHSKRDTEGDITYRPVFVLAEAPELRDAYAGNIWVFPQPHERGDLVPGRYDPKNGEMRSDKMMGRSVVIGRIAQVLGLVIALQGVAMLFGVPERVLPLKVTTGRHRRAVPLWGGR